MLRFTTMTAIAALMIFHRPALAGPNGGTVVQGSAAISQAGSVTNINQSSNAAIINWQGFSIGGGETVNFNQPSSLSATLNRVIGNETSIISGALNANGRVFIVNSAGVLFTKGAQVNVGGLVASTLDISDADFMAGNYNFSGTSAASVVNQGRIHASPGGYVALLGKTVSNDGVISATLGTVAMAAGNKITLNFDGNSLVDVTIDEGTLNALVENKRAIRADGGRVIMTAKAADAVLSAQVNNSGIIQARTMAALKGGSGRRASAHVGSIKLLADGGTTNVAGRLDASAPKGGDGGTIETSGDKVKVANSAVVTTKSVTGKTGIWLVDPDGFTIAAAGGDISGTTLGAELAANNVTLASTRGSGTDSNINVDDAVTWSANTTLTLNATNDININAPISASGTTAGLVLNYGGFATTGSAAPGTNYSIANGASVALSFGGLSTNNAGVISGLSINGQLYTLIQSIGSPKLADGITNNPDDLNIINVNGGSGFYALAQDLTSTITYTSAVVATLSGTLAGLGHTISSLTINNPTAGSKTALIGSTTAGSLIRDIGVVNANISGRGNTGQPNGTGGLVGTNVGTISNAYASNVTVNMTSGGNAGGLVGLNEGGLINNSYADGAVMATDSSDIGGLVGNNAGGKIINSHAIVDVTVTETSNAPFDIGSIGGLVGSNNMSASIIGSYAAGNVLVSGAQQVANIGGLAGDNTSSSISGSRVIGGSVTAANGMAVGGLVGINSAGASIVSSSASAAVSGLTQVGGLAGLNSGSTITGSQATGAVTATAANGDVGGLVGENHNTTIFATGATNFGVISDSSASGHVTGAAGAQIGGLVGLNDTGAKIASSTASSDVTVLGAGTSGNAGGFVGENLGTITDSSSSGDVSGAGTLGAFAGLNLGSIDDSSATGQVNGHTGTFDGSDALTNPFTHKTTRGTETDNTYHDVKAEAAAAAQAAQAAEHAGSVIATTSANSATTPPSSATSAAGTQATTDPTTSKADDNLKSIEDKIKADEQHAHRHTAATSPPRKSGGRGAGFGATIRSIEINGQRFELENGGSKNGGVKNGGSKNGAPQDGAPGQKAP